MEFKIHSFFLTRMIDGKLEMDGEVYHIEATAPDGKQEALKVAMCLEEEDAQMLTSILNAAKDQPEVQAWVERLFTRWRDHLEALEASLDPTPVSLPEPPAAKPKRKPRATPTPPVLRGRRWTQD